MLSAFLKKQPDAVKYSRSTLEILQLLRSENVGPKTYFELIKLFGSAKTALQHIEEFSVKGGRRKPIKLCSSAAVEKEIEEINKIGAVLITHLDSEYSRLLLHISDPPPVLTCQGNLSLLNTPILAVVGSRNASLNAITFTKNIVKDISKNSGTIIASGLARGIDTIAHQSSLPNTIAVIAGGINHIYPTENTKLHQQIAKEGGLIVAELPIHTIPVSKNFPQRNRIIAGIALGTLVIEASMKSGSLITARFTLEYDRELFAVPGFPYDPRCQGTNYLIKNGAYLVEKADDIIQAMPKHQQKAALYERSSDDFKYIDVYKPLDITDEYRKNIQALISSSPVEIDLLVQSSGLPIGIVSVVLLELELAGKIIRYPGNRVGIVYE